MKKIIFNLLPKKLQQKIIHKKTGSIKLKANLPENISFDMVIVPKSDLWKQRLNTFYGHEPLITKFIERYIQEDDIFYEIGAQMGYFPSLISTINPAILIYAFEANWFTYNYLIENKKLNDPKNKWKTFNYYISDFSGKRDGNNYLSINDAIKKGFDVPTIFQMDVDGEEYKIIKGASDLLVNGITEFLIEVHPKDLKDRGVAIMEFLDLFDKNTFSFSYLPNLRSDDSKWVHSLDEVDLTDEFYLYAVPKRKKNRLNL
jgi:hypothetical protein